MKYYHYVRLFLGAILLFGMLFASGKVSVFMWLIRFSKRKRFGYEGEIMEKRVAVMWKQYFSILLAYIQSPGAVELSAASEFGEECLRQGMCVSELVELHLRLVGEHQQILPPEYMAMSQDFLLEATRPMSLANGVTSTEIVLATLYDNSLKQVLELRDIKRRLIQYSQKLEKKVEDRQKEAQAAEERFQGLVETIPDIVYQIDVSGRFVYLNSAVRWLGYEPEELLGKHFSQIVHVTDLKRSSALYVLPGVKGRVTGDQEAPRLFDERRTGARKTTGLELGIFLKSEQIDPGTIQRVGREVCPVEINSFGMYSTGHDGQPGHYAGTLGVIRDSREQKKKKGVLNFGNFFRGSSPKLAQA